MAFTIPTEGDRKIVGKTEHSPNGIFGYLEFEFTEKEKSFMEFRNHIGSVLRLNLRISQLNIGKNGHVTAYVVFLVHLFSLRK